MIGFACLFVLFVSVFGLMYAYFNYVCVKSKSEGTAEMKEIAAAIRVGSKAFLYQEYRVIAVVAILVAYALGVFIQPSCALAILLGATLSGLAGYIGMKSSTYCNVRVAETARTTKDISKTLKVALRGGSVMGLCVDSLALMGLALVIFGFSEQIEQSVVTNWLGLCFDPFSMTITSYALGCSLIAMFSRIAGGIYTKAADVGADLVGKVEESIPEDDPRNPGVIADSVGDNVGDTAGLGADLLESKVASAVAGMVLVRFIYERSDALEVFFYNSQFYEILFYPCMLYCYGILASAIGLWYVLEISNGKNPKIELNKVVIISTIFTALFNWGISSGEFSMWEIENVQLKFGGISIFIASLIGIVSGVLVGAITQYYTSSKEKPTIGIAEAAKEGSPSVIIQGLSVGMKSTLGVMFVLALTIILAYFIAGEFGVAIAGVGMMSFSATMVSIDTYGPIADNAGGIAEMAHLGSDVRKITDHLDAVGNTTAAVGKGFSIGSATIATVALLISYMFAFTPTQEAVLNIVNPVVLSGALIGVGSAFFFTGLLIESVSKTAQKMIREIRRQFREIKGLKEGFVKPDYESCVKIATVGALSEMKKPVLIAVLLPISFGFVIGSKFVGGFQIGATLGAIALAVFCGNSGGAWDNAKKLIESRGQKGTEHHASAVVGDTVGDPLKDTSGPALNILIKISCTVALLLVPIFSIYNLFG